MATPKISRIITLSSNPWSLASIVSMISWPRLESTIPTIGNNRIFFQSIVIGVAICAIAFGFSFAISSSFFYFLHNLLSLKARMFFQFILFSHLLHTAKIKNPSLCTDGRNLGSLLYLIGSTLLFKSGRSFLIYISLSKEIITSSLLINYDFLFFPFTKSSNESPKASAIFASVFLVGFLFLPDSSFMTYKYFPL